MCIGRERLVYLSAFASLLPLVPASLLASDLSNVSYAVDCVVII